MGRKSRIARGLDIGAASRKMMEKALGTVLTDEEYFTLEHQALKSPMERDLEEFEEIMFNEEPEWWMPYAEPLPTWVRYDQAMWRMAVTRISHRPPSQELKKEGVKGTLAGLVMGEGHIGYARRYYKGETPPYRVAPLVRVKMKDIEIVTRICELVNIGMRKEQGVYISSIEGLRPIIINRITLPYMTGTPKRKAKYQIKYGYAPTTKEADQFLATFGGKHTKTAISGSQEIIEEAWLSPPPRETE